jgi:hypothetical protein
LRISMIFTFDLEVESLTRLDTSTARRLYKIAHSKR